MKDKIQVYNNCHCTMERLFPSGYYLLKVYIGSELHDKVRCDDYRDAMDYWKSFKKIAKWA